jgi:hypothetical protein
MPSVIAHPTVKSIRETMNNAETTHLIEWLLLELETGPRLVDANYLNFLHQVITELHRFLDGVIDVTSARKLALAIHRYARTSIEEPTRYLFRMLGHAVATIHVKTHAFGFVYYWFRYIKETKPTELLEAIYTYQKRVIPFGEMSHE